MCFVFTGKKEMGLLCIWANTKAISQSQVRNKAFDLLDYFIVDFHLCSCAHLLWLCVFSCEMCLVGDYRWHVRLRLNWYHQDISRMKLLGRIAIVIKLNWMKKKKICLILMCMWILYTTLTHIVMQNERYKADRIELLWRKMMQLVMFGSITWKANTNGS